MINTGPDLSPVSAGGWSLRRTWRMAGRGGASPTSPLSPSTACLSSAAASSTAACCSTCVPTALKRLRVRIFHPTYINISVPECYLSWGKKASSGLCWEKSVFIISISDCCCFFKWIYDFTIFFLSFSFPLFWVASCPCPWENIKFLDIKQAVYLSGGAPWVCATNRSVLLREETCIRCRAESLLFWMQKHTNTHRLMFSVIGKSELTLNYITT